MLLMHPGGTEPARKARAAHVPLEALSLPKKPMLLMHPSPNIRLICYTFESVCDSSTQSFN